MSTSSGTPQQTQSPVFGKDYSMKDVAVVARYQPWLLYGLTQQEYQAQQAQQQQSQPNSLGIQFVGTNPLLESREATLARGPIVQSKPSVPETIWNLRLPTTAFLGTDKTVATGQPEPGLTTLTVGDYAIMTAIAVPSAVLPALIPETLLESQMLSVAARTALVGGIGAAGGYVTGGPKMAVVGGLLGAGAYLGFEGATWLYRYASISDVPSVGTVELPDIGYTAPRTMSEKVLGFPELESPYIVKGLQPLEAESTAWQMGLSPKTAMTDPLAELTEPPTLEKPIPGMMYLPKPELTARVSDVGFLPKGLFGNVGGLLSVQALSRSLSAPKVSPVLRGLPSLDLGFNPDVASALKNEQVAVPAQSLVSLQVPVQETIQIPKLAMPSPNLSDFQFPRLNGGSDDSFKRFFNPQRRRKGGWERMFLWEFPVKGPKETWMALSKR